MNIIVALLVFSLIVIIHELGHFLLAVRNGIFVTEFSVGMGPRIISVVKTKKGYRPRLFLNQHEFENNEDWKEATKYSWKLLPLGGSCMMLGEDALCEDERAFGKKGVWARISVIFAGPLFNFILSFFLALFIIGTIGFDKPYLTEVKKDSPAAMVGLQEGDLITNFNGRNVSLYRQIDSYLLMNPITEEPIEVTYERDGVKKTVELAPTKMKTYWLGFSYYADNNVMKLTDVTAEQSMAKAGIKTGDVITSINGTTIVSGSAFREYIAANPLSDQPLSVTYERDGVSNTVEVTPAVYSDKYSVGFTVNAARAKGTVFETIKYSFVEVKHNIVTVVDSLGQMIKGKVSKDDIAGPVGIFSFIGDSYESSKAEGTLYVFLNLANISLMLSANLGVMNLLPIPALDGGRLIFLFLEVLRGKPVSQDKEGFVHMIGLIALLILMAFIFINDIGRIFR